jgi:glycosyltransferase involved in cell wall biosynthesis
MKVLMISPYPTVKGKILGGVQAVATSLVSALTRIEEIESLYVLCFYVGQPPLKSWVQDGKQINIFIKAPNVLEASTFFLFDRVRAWVIANQIRPDVIHGQGVGKDGYISTHLGYPSLATVHGVSSVEARLGTKSVRNNIAISLADRRMDSTLKFANVVISTTKYDATIVHPKVSGHHLLIRNPVSQEFFTMGGNNSFHNNADRFEILFAGTIIPRKNITGLLKAFKDVLKYIPNVGLTLIGPQTDKVYFKKCQALVIKLGLSQNIRFLGHVDQDLLLDELRKCSCLVLFSNEETSPTIIMQAMAVGKPVVASSVGGVPELVNNGLTGYLVSAQNDIELGNRLVEMLEDKQGRIRMGTTAQEYARKHFSPEKVAESTFSAYQSALGLLHKIK